MKNLRKFGSVIASLLCLLFCLALMPAVSAIDTADVDQARAYQADSACASMREILAESGDLTAIELLYVYSDGSNSRNKLWTEYVISPEEAFCRNMERTLIEDNENRTLSRVIFSTVDGGSRVSFQLSENSIFERLSEPIEFPEGEESHPATQEELDEVMYVTPDFQLLPASAFGLEEGARIYEWMFSGHVLELIPRPGGYKVTLQYDNGTIESRFFTEFSNGKPFPQTPPGYHGWAYTLSDEEIKTAMTFYGQKMTVGELIEKVAPQELDIMDDTIRAEAYTVPYVWQDPDGPGSPWTIQLSRSSMTSATQIIDEENLLPDLSDVPVGKEIKSGPGWELVIEVREDLINYTSMAAFYQKQCPEIWNSLPADTQRELEQKPPRFGSVVISRTLSNQQKEIIKGIWGSVMTNEEYFSLVWPDLWAAMPSWEKGLEWYRQVKIWEESDPEEGMIPEDYVDITHGTAKTPVVVTSAKSTVIKSVENVAVSAVANPTLFSDTGISSAFMSFQAANLGMVPVETPGFIALPPSAINPTQVPPTLTLLLSPDPPLYNAMAFSFTSDDIPQVSTGVPHSNDQASSANEMTTGPLVGMESSNHPTVDFQYHHEGSAYGFVNDFSYATAL